MSKYYIKVDLDKNWRDAFLKKTNNNRTFYLLRCTKEFQFLGEVMPLMKGEWIMKKSYVYSIVIIIALFFCVSSSYASETVKFLVVGPMTGDSAAQGIQLRQGAELAVQEINAAGGLNGKKLVFEVADDTGNPNQATIVAQKFSLDKDILFICGPVNSSCAIASLPIWEKTNVPMISPCNTAANLTRLGHKNYFRIIVNDDIMSRQIVEVAIKTLGMKKPALVWENSDYGKGMRDIAVSEIPKLGVKVVAEDSYVPGTDRDYSAIITKYKGLGIDGVLILGDYTAGGLFAKQAYNLGFHPKLAGSASCAHPKLMEIGGQGAENFYVQAPFDPFDTRPKQAAFIERFQKLAKDRPGEWGAHAYDVVYVAKTAYEKGGKDRASFINALHKINNFEGVTGTFGFDQFGDVPAKTVTVLVVKDGKFVNYEKK